MDRKIEELREWGCDIDNTMERMLFDKEFYLECLTDIPNDPNFSRLSNALVKQDVTAAFDGAHTLKGVFINLGLTPMYNKVVEIVEPLRAGKTEGFSKRMRSFCK